MFKALVKTRIQAYFSSIAGKSKGKSKSKARSALFALLYLYVAGCFLFIMGMFFNAIAGPFYNGGISWFYFAFYGMTSFALMFIFSIFMTQSQIYDAKDNELLLSMPIPSRYILGSRILALVLENLVYGLVVAIPALVAWLMAAPLSTSGIIAFVLITLLMPFLVFAVSGIFGYILHVILSHVRNKSLIGTFVSLAFLAAYFYFYSKINTYVQMLVVNGETLAGKISGAVRPIYWLGAAISDGNLLYLLGVILIILAAFFAVYTAISATFIRTASTKRGLSKKKYEQKAMKASTASSALLRKEFNRLFSSTVYIMNSGVGVIMLVGASIYAIVKKNTIVAYANQVMGIGDIIGPCAVLLICLLLSMILFSAPSISLEGKSIWIPKSLPVPATTILMSKVRLHVIITAPAALIASLSVIYILNPSPLMTALTILLPLAFTAFTALLGVAVNLKFPKFDWTNEAQVIKQGVCVLICMFGTMLAILIPVGIYALLLTKCLDAELALGIYTVIIAAAAFVLYRYLNNGGARRFQEL